MPLNHPTITKVVISEEEKFIDSSQTITIAIEVRDGGNPRNRPLLDPTQGAYIDILGPDGGVVVEQGVMEKINLGLWGYRHTPELDALLGYYTCNIAAATAAGTARLANIGIFKIISTGVVTVFDYFGIRDQEHNIWYWWINDVPELVSADEVPDIQLRAAQAIDLGDIPYWIEVQSSVGLTRYIHPTLAGEPVVATAQPPIGFGVINSPQVTTALGGEYIIGSNVADEVVLIKVM